MHIAYKAKYTGIQIMNTYVWITKMMLLCEYLKPWIPVTLTDLSMFNLSMVAWFDCPAEEVLDMIITVIKL